MSKARAEARIDAATDAELREFEDEQNLESRSDAVRKLLRRGLNDYNSPGPFAELFREGAKLTLIAAALALVIATAFGYPSELVASAAGFGVMSLGCTASYAIAVERIELPRISIERPDREVRADGGEPE